MSDLVTLKGHHLGPGLYVAADPDPLYIQLFMDREADLAKLRENLIEQIMSIASFRETQLPAPEHKWNIRFSRHEVYENYGETKEELASRAASALLGSLATSFRPDGVSTLIRFLTRKDASK